MKTPAERKRAQRIRMKGSKASPTERAWLEAYNRDASAPSTPKPIESEHTAAVPATAPSPEPVTAAAPVADAPAAAATEAVTKIDMGPDVPGPVPSAPQPASTSTSTSTSTSIAPTLPVGMTDDVARSAASFALGGIAFAWRQWGDRDAPEASAEHRRILAKVIANYATKWGWTSELDDMLLLLTVIGSYNMQCARAPSLSKRIAAETETKK